MPRAKLRTETLRAALVESAMGLLESDGLPLTARSVSNGANTSTAALYELFGDKAGLVRAVFLGGFELLATELAGVELTDDPAVDLRALLEASRRFALRRPMLFEVMFSRPFAEFEPTDADRRAAGEIHRLVMRTVRRAIHDGHWRGDPTDVALALIVTNRGLIAAELAGLLGSNRGSAERRRHLTLDALLSGFATDRAGR